MPPDERRRFRRLVRLVRLAIADAFRGELTRSHAEIVERAEHTA